ncbi:MAG: type IV pilus secretin PilQ [Polyangiaceae bacterium]
MHRVKLKRLGTGTLLALATLLSASASRADAGPNHVRDVQVRTDAVTRGAEIVVTGTGTPSYASRVEAGGKRLVVDLSNADILGAPEAVTGDGGLVGGVLTQTFKSGPSTFTRLTINLAKTASYQFRAEGDKLRILFAPADKTGDATKPIQLSKELTEAPKAATANAKTSAPGAVVTADVKDIRFERMPKAAAAAGGRCTNGCDRVVVSLAQIPSYSVTTGPSGKLRLEMKSTNVPESLVRTLDVTAYKGALKSVATFKDGTTGSTVIEIDRGIDSPGYVTVDGTQLAWSFEVPGGADMPSPIVKGQVQNGAKDESATRRTRTVAREDVGPDVPKVERSIRGDDDVVVETSGGSQAAGFASSMQAQITTGRYNGRRINLDFKDIDIHNVLRLLSDVGRVNIVTADDVQGTITIRMNQVPWDQALDVVLQAKGLGMLRQGNLIRVAPMATLQKERELRIAQQKQEYELTPLETRLIPVSYASAEELQARAKELLSPRGSIAVDERTNVLIARDIGSNLNHVEELVRSLDTQTPQVLVEARIVEATSRYLRDVGIQWGGDTTFSEATGNPTGVAFPSRITASGGNYDAQTPTAGISPFTRVVQQPNFAVNLPAAVGTGQGGALGFSFGSIDNAFNLNVRLSAAETSGLLRIVSSPRILTLDNREARINQGTLIPFAQISAQGVQTTFQEAKLQLIVRPHVTADGSVAMHVKINRDEPDFNQTSARGDPTILKREAETDLLVVDGHTAVIGGIFTRNTGRNVDQVPFFGDIPILGILFQRRRASDTRNELVIFLTPRIVNRAEALGR